MSGVNDQQWIVGDQSYYENDPITGQEKHLGYEKPEDDFDDEADPGKKRKGRGTLGFIWGAGSSL